MGFKQTPAHIAGKASYHQIGLVQGQFGDVPLDKWLDQVAKAGFDGIELATWLLKITDPAALAAELVAKVQQRGLSIFSAAAHLQGQILGDEPSAKTLQFMGPDTESVQLYSAWRAAGNTPPATNPYMVPDNVGAAMHKEATAQMIAVGKLVAEIGKLTGRVVPVSGFIGSPAHSWADMFPFPPHPKVIGGHTIEDSRVASLRLLVQRFGPIFDVYKSLGVKFGHECHPTERAMGDLRSAEEVLATFDKAGYGGTFGYNFDGSHLIWQRVALDAFIRRFADVIWSVHMKGARVSGIPTAAGLLGGHCNFGDPDRAWDFVSAGCGRDAVNHEEVIVALNDAGYDGALSVEWEDPKRNGAEGAAGSLAALRAIDLPPAGAAFDAAFSQAT